MKGSLLMHALGRRSVILGVLSAVSSLAAAVRADVVHFTESAAARGFVYSNLEGMFGGTGQYGCGVALCDLDNDGDDDLIATGGSPSMVLYANNGAGYFTNVTATAGLGAPTNPRASCAPITTAMATSTSSSRAGCSLQFSTETMAV